MLNRESCTGTPDDSLTRVALYFARKWVNTDRAQDRVIGASLTRDHPRTARARRVPKSLFFASSWSVNQVY